MSSNQRTSTAQAPRPIVFLGPSLPDARARTILTADYRAPVQKGDLDGVPAGAVVAVIDGVFDPASAVSSSELRDAVARGVHLFGSAGMGAVRANEVPGVVGVGRVYEMFQRGELERDDEVAVAFDPDSLQPLSVPLVNVRHAVDRLVGPGTLSSQLGQEILDAAHRLPYPERDYPRIIEAAGLSGRSDAPQLISMLASHDLAQDDAITLLERLRGARPVRASAGAAPPETTEISAVLAADAPIHLWEYGPPIPFAAVVRFLKVTGAFSGPARAAVARFVLEGNELDVRPGKPRPEVLRDELLNRLRLTWEWSPHEQIAISLRDLGLGVQTVDERLGEEVETERRVMALAREAPAEFLHALRVELLFDDLTLKREAARWASLEALAEHGGAGGDVRPDEWGAALDKVCAKLGVRDERQAIERLARWGVTARETRNFVELLARARRAASKLRRARVSPARTRGGPLRRSPKITGQRRFCWTFADALAATRKLQNTIGITRIEVITGLGDVGIPNAQAFRPDGVWANNVGSGKSETVAGAKIGAVMEEVEKWAQERFGDPPRATVHASWEALRRGRRRAVDPRTLDLPYDTCYLPDLEIDWLECDDLIGGARVLVPLAPFVVARASDDICYSPRGGRKVVDTNGLASGFTLEEALSHAISEYIERHSATMHDVVECNPGAPTASPRFAIDLETVPASTRRLVRSITRAGHRLRIWDITSEIGVPCFAATVLTARDGGQAYQSGWLENLGHAAHPDPEVAINMAILEASQAILHAVARARPEVTLAARSLGRHERSRARRSSAYVAARRPDPPFKAFAAVPGFVSRDARDDVLWLRDRLCAAGCEHLLFVELTRDEIRPARVVRVIVPGLETINPYRTGVRARMALLSDLV